MKNLHQLTLKNALEGLKNNKFTSLELTKACLERIEALNEKIGVFITVTNDLALEQAKKADKLIAEHGSEAFKSHPLLGIPYACKDNFSTKGIETTASSNILKGYKPPYESTVTKRLQNAGAVLLGKTNLDAFAHGSSTETSDFFTTKNPWNLKTVAGGSSGGSSAAVAANMCVFAIGSETAGSIRGPASWCGITGFKPTYGRVSRYGVIAMASSTDSPGPLTKTTEDAAIIMEIIAGNDPFDATSSPEEVPNYAKNLDKFTLKGIKIGKPKSYFTKEIDSKVLEAVEDACDKFAELGAEIVEIDLMDPKYSIAVYTILQRSEVSSNLARFDGIRFGHDRSKFGKEARNRMMLGAFALSSGYYDAYYAKAQKVRTLIVEDFKKAYKEVDLIIGPTMPTVALELGASEKSPIFGELMDVLVEPSAIAGLTGISVNCGFVNDLPVGFQLIGNQLDEEKVLGAAHVYQQNTDFHKEFPEF